MARRLDVHDALWPVAIAAIAAVFGLVAAVNPLIAIGGAGAIGFVALSASDLTLGVALFAFMAFLEVLPGVGGLSAAKLAGGVLVLCWIAAGATMSRDERRRIGQAHPAIAVLSVAFTA